MKTEKTLKMLKMLHTLTAQAKKAQKLQNKSKNARPGIPKPKAKDLDPTVEAELKAAFTLFDTSYAHAAAQNSGKTSLLSPASLSLCLSRSSCALEPSRVDPTVATASSTRKSSRR